MDSPRGTHPFGHLLPVGGGDPIPLFQPRLTVGRREGADIVLRFPNVSGTHCLLWLEDGYWHVKDEGSSNGTKVNGVRVTEQRLNPGDKISIARHAYEIAYEPAHLGAVAAHEEKTAQESVFGRSLLESAGLENRRPGGPASATKPRHPT